MKSVYHTGENRLFIGHEVFDEPRTDILSTATSTIESHVVENNESNVWFEPQQFLELALHRPVCGLIQYVGFGDGATDEFSELLR